MVVHQALLLWRGLGELRNGLLHFHPLDSTTNPTLRTNHSHLTLSVYFFHEVHKFLAMVSHTMSHLLLGDLVLSLMANLDTGHHPPLVDMEHHPPLVDMEEFHPLVDMEEHHPLVDMEEHHPLVDMGHNLRQLGMEHTLDMAHSSLLNRAMLLKVPS